ncbi:MAG: hypothetical protein JJ974_03000 [Phycisphaerales bacterium]|nr:hypothetical protein [Phycisphaerales bacterium]
MPTIRLWNLFRSPYLVKRCILLDHRVRRNIVLLFDENDREEAYRLIREYKAYWCWEQLRCELAALKCSNGSLDDLREAIELGEWDLRELLMAAKFGHDGKAHLTWCPDPKE